MIALPGLCLTTGRPEIAREILLSFAAHVDQGMLPNRFPDVGDTPEYNTVDATLWYFAAIYRYIEATGDVALLRESLWSVLQEIVTFHRQGTRYNIHVDPADHLLYAGQAGVQLTWMDAKVGDWVVTPRIGKPVEINALWYNALRTMAHFAGLLNDVLPPMRIHQEADADAGRVSRAALLAPGRSGTYTMFWIRPPRSAGQRRYARIRFLRCRCRFQSWSRVRRWRHPSSTLCARIADAVRTAHAFAA